MDATSLSTGTVVDRYTLDAPIGEGGMAMVFRVRHNGLGTMHALKVLTLGGSQIRERLRQEGQVQATLKHPNVITVTDMIDLGGSPGLIMEYVAGPCLHDYLRDTRLSVDQADELARGILSGVAAAHGRGLIHRDLKPANIMLQVTDRGLVPKITDFGLAKLLGEGGRGFNKTRTGSTMGTPHYMSPEQVRDSKNVDTATDIFALGAILYELVCGERAFDGRDLLEIFNAVAHGKYIPPRDVVPELPQRMHDAIVAALQVDPSDRPPSCEALLQQWLGVEAVAGNPVASAFSGASIERARSLGSKASFMAPPGSVVPESAPSDATWADDPSGRGEAPKSTSSAEDLGRSLLNDRPDTISQSRVVMGLGGISLLLVALAGSSVVAGLVFGAVVWFGSPRTVDDGAQHPPAVVGNADVDDEPSVAAARPPPTALSAPATTDKTADAPVAIASGEPARGTTPQPSRGDTSPAAAPPPDALVEADEATDDAVGAVDVAPPPDDLPPPDDPDPDEVDPVADAAPPEPAPASATGPDKGPLLASPDPDDRKRGIDNLAKRSDDDAVLLLTNMAIEENDSTVRRYAWRVLASRVDDKFGDYWIMLRGVTWTLANAGERDARDAAALLGRNSANPDDLMAGLTSSSAAVRKASIDAVASMGNKAPIGYDFDGLLEPLTADADSSVANKARQALKRLP